MSQNESQLENETKGLEIIRQRTKDAQAELDRVNQLVEDARAKAKATIDALDQDVESAKKRHDDTLNELQQADDARRAKIHAATLEFKRQQQAERDDAKREAEVAVTPEE